MLCNNPCVFVSRFLLALCLLLDKIFFFSYKSNEKMLPLYPLFFLLLHLRGSTFIMCLGSASGSSVSDCVFFSLPKDLKVIRMAIIIHMGATTFSYCSFHCSSFSELQKALRADASMKTQVLLFCSQQ